jgi:hypothetical protein
MRRHTLITALLAISGSALWADAAERLAGDDLRKSVSGKTIYFATPIGAEIPIRYRPNGSMSAATSDSLAALGGEDVSSDTGRWWVVRERLCQQWRNWLESRSYCYEFRIAGEAVQWQRDDGASGTARIASN